MNIGVSLKLQMASAGLVLAMVSAGCATVADDRSSLIGTWKVVAFEIEFQDTGERLATFGKSPRGYIIFAPEGRTMSYIEAETRKSPKTDEERVAAYRTILAYTGRYRLESGRFITKVDGAWNVDWVGTEQERSFKLDGGRLHIVTQWNPAPAFKNRMVRAVLVCEAER